MSSANVELVRSIWEAWENGDFSSSAWADPDIELVFTGDFIEPGTSTGAVGMAEAWGDFLGAWEDFRGIAEEVRELDDGRVLVLNHFGGRAKTSGLEVEDMHVRAAALFHLAGGKVTRLVLYTNRERAMADLGL